MSDEQSLSQQDVQDLQDIASKLPTGHPMQKKISLLLNSQKTQFEKDRPGTGINLQGAGDAAWDAAKGIGSSVGALLDPTQGVSGAALTAAHLNPRSGSITDRLGETPIAGAGREAIAGWKRGKESGNPLSPMGEALTSGLGGMVGMSADRAAQHASRGEGGAILGEAAVPAALALSPLAKEGLGRTGEAIAPSIANRVRTPSNALTPATRNIARVGGFVGGMALSPAAKWEAGLIGGALGPTLADAFLPKRTIPESGAPLPSAEDFYSRSGAEQNAIFNRGTGASDLARSRSQSTVFPQPLRPLIGTPEDWATYERQMDILRPEASDAGTYHAARGATSKKLTLQERMGKKFNQ